MTTPLPTNIDETYPDGNDPNRKAHQQAHDVIHGRLNGLTAEMAEDISAALAAEREANNGLFAPVNHTQPASTITDFTEAVQDAVAALLSAGGNVTLDYDDVTGLLTITAGGGAPSALVNRRVGFWAGGAFASAMNTFSLAINTLTVRPFVVLAKNSYDALGVAVAAAATAGGQIELVVYGNNGSGGPGPLVASSGAIDSTSAGNKTVVVPAFELDEGVYWVGAISRVAACTIRGYGGIVTPFLSESVPPSSTAAFNSRSMAVAAGSPVPATFSATPSVGNAEPAVGLRYA